MEASPNREIRVPATLIPDPHRLGERAAAGPGPIGAYVHFPYCRRHCWYCDFNVHLGDDIAIAAYLEALEAETVAVATFLDPCPAVETLYVGGGTPSHAGPDRLGRLLGRLRDELALPRAAEFSVEVNPVDASPELFAAMSASGVNRVSLGVQSFADRDLVRLDRDHDGCGARMAAQMALQAGFGSVSIDLIYGTPGQTPAQWRGELENAVRLGVGHVSCYALTLDSQRSQRRSAALGGSPDGDGMLPYYQAALEVLGAAGFEHYETSNFARPGHHCRHNAAVWAGGRYLPLGCGAHGFIGDRRYHLVRRPDSYAERICAGLPVVAGAEELQRSDLLLEAVTLPLRTAVGVDLDLLQVSFGYDLLAAQGPVIDRLSGAGLLAVDDGRLRPTDQGMFVADALGAALLPAGALPA